MAVPPSGMLGHVRVSVSLNGQQYSGGATAGDHAGAAGSASSSSSSPSSPSSSPSSSAAASVVVVIAFYDPDGEELPPYGGTAGGMAQVTASAQAAY